ncbi:MAG: MFS transporter [Betaproteobacteria bacterium]|nr:MFS transporter [Betaproteobacteria bacterium]
MGKKNIPSVHIESRILLVRGHRVMLDSDLAELYGVTTKRLNEQVRSNADRFPGDFVFQLTRQEAKNLRSQSATSNLVTYLSDSLNYSLVAAGLVFSVAQSAGAGGRVLWGYLADRLLSGPVMLGCLGITIAGTGVAVAFIDPATPWPLLVVLFGLYGAAGIGWNGVYLAEVARQAPPGNAGVATGGALWVTFLGIVVGPPLFGAIISSTDSYAVSFTATSLPAAACGLVLLAARRSFANNA